MSTPPPASSAEAGAPPALELRGVTKRFPGVVANAGVDLVLRRGEVHCLLGENGAGKSTLMNVAYGLYRPDEGEVRVRGRPVRLGSPADAIAAGIGMVHQHFQLVGVFTVAENVVLGRETRRGLRLDLAQARRIVADLAGRYGLAVDPDARIDELSVGARQRVELIKALYRDADVLILDEPTAVLTPGEVDDFFGVVKRLVSGGKSVILITHKLREVLAVADRVTVMRGGRVVGTADPRTATARGLATLMVGRDVSFGVEKAPAAPGPPAGAGEEGLDAVDASGRAVLAVRALEVADDRGATTVQGLDLDVRAGEILGIAGVEGNGQRELVEAIAGMRPPAAGRIMIGGRDTAGLTPRQVAELGVGHVPEDRGRHGLVAPFSVADNLVLNRCRRRPFSRWSVLRRQAVARHAAELVAAFDIRTPSVDTPVGQLSGGNQQKVVVARELSGQLMLLVVAQPTRGLDVGSVEFIHTQIVRRRDAGVAVLLVSAELDEVLSLSDRVAVLYRGRIARVMDRAEATRERVGVLMACGRDEEAVA
ncbi:MAG: ABC transporter ATP-binding protein [Egibacteraceae bacterium]